MTNTQFKKPNEIDSSSYTLRQSVEFAIEQYFSHLEEEETSELYALVIKEVEIGLFNVVMKKAQGNQSKAADWLGLARGTLRKRLHEYEIE
jgi:Fis family transcriptional regulator